MSLHIYEIGDESDNEEENPFRIPTDEDVFLMRQNGRKRRDEERQRLSRLSVQEKRTFNTRSSMKRHMDIEEKLAKERQATLRQKEKFPPIDKERQEKEHLSQFIEKKKQMFFLTMGLDTKKQEIKKLERKAEERERKLAIEEQALKRDALRFNHFLTNNDIQAVQAITNAEEETKLKQNRQLEIRKLTAKQNAILNDIQKLKDQLLKYDKYREFLDSLTPESWYQEQKVKNEKREQERVKAMKQPSRRSSLSQSIRPSTAKMAHISQIPEAHREELSEKEDVDEPMYFEQPEQLIAKFTSLEEENLSLIQRSHEVEEQLDDLLKREREYNEKIEQQSKELYKQIEILDKFILEEKEQRDIIQQKAGSNRDENYKKLRNLRRTIQEIYDASCETMTAADDPDPIYMLAQIESKLESQLAELDLLSPDFVAKLERQRDKDRKKIIREAKNNRVQERLNEMRRIKSAEPKAKTTKRIGKPLMARTRPVDQNKKLTDESKIIERENEQKRDEFKELFS